MEYTYIYFGLCMGTVLTKEIFFNKHDSEIFFKIFYILTFFAYIGSLILPLVKG